MTSDARLPAHFGGATQGADADGSDDDEEDAAAHMERRRGALKLLAFILVLLIIVPNIAKALAGEDAETFASLQCRKAGDRNDIHLVSSRRPADNETPGAQPPRGS